MSSIRERFLILNEGCANLCSNGKSTMGKLKQLTIWQCLIWPRGAAQTAKVRILPILCLVVLAAYACISLQGCLPPDWSFCDCDFRDNFWNSIINDVHLLLGRKGWGRLCSPSSRQHHISRQISAITTRRSELSGSTVSILESMATVRNYTRSHRRIYG